MNIKGLKVAAPGYKAWLSGTETLEKNPGICVELLHAQKMPTE